MPPDAAAHGHDGKLAPVLLPFHQSYYHSINDFDAGHDQHATGMIACYVADIANIRVVIPPNLSEIPKFTLHENENSQSETPLNRVPPHLHPLVYMSIICRIV